MNKPHTAAMFKRIQVRAYYLWINAIAFDDVDAWLIAERTELALAADKRHVATKKAAATRKAKAALLAPLDAKAAKATAYDRAMH